MNVNRTTRYIRLISVTPAFAFWLTAGCTNPVNDEVAGLTDKQRIDVRRALTADQLKELDDWIIRKSNINIGQQPGAKSNQSPEDRDRWPNIAGKTIPRGITVAQALKDQDEWIAKQKIEQAGAAEKKKAEQAQLAATQAGLAKILTVTLLSKENEVLKDDRNYVVLELSYENKGDRDIRGVEGILKFSDTHGQPVAAINWSFSGGIPAKRIAIEREANINVSKSSEPLERLWETDFDKLTLTFAVSSIAFNDAPSGGAPATKGIK